MLANPSNIIYPDLSYPSPPPSPQRGRGLRRELSRTGRVRGSDRSLVLLNIAGFDSLNSLSFV
jgi:hypothetical protein